MNSVMLDEYGIADTPEPEASTAEASTLILPPWTDASEFCATPCEPPPQIIGGIAHQGCKLVFGGPSKACKSWVMLDLSLSVASGAPWLGFSTTQAPVVFVNFELPVFAIHHRLCVIAAAKGVTIPANGQLVVWNLRGHAAPYDILLPALTTKIKERNFGLVVLDPSYKLLGQADENSARDTAQLLNSIERLAVETGATTAFTSHFAKGNASGKESIDRISGSGVFARDPDSILTATALETPDAYAIEPILRTLPPHPPFAVRWEYPLMRVAEDLDPSKLKRAPGGRQPGHDPLDLLEAIKDTTAENPVSISKWASAAGIIRSTLQGYMNGMRVKGWINTVGDGNTARQYITQKGQEALKERGNA
jgi:hypothetical protein